MSGDGPIGNISPVDSARRDEILAGLETVLASPSFASVSSRRARLLRYLVERALTGEGERTNEYAIGVDVFGKPPSFDPRIEAGVRTDVGRLRQKLKDYYKGEGCGDRIVIELPLRSYAVVFRLRSLEPVPTAADFKDAAVTQDAPAPSRRRWHTVGGVLVGAAFVIASVLALQQARNQPASPVSRAEGLPRMSAVQVNGVCKVGNCANPYIVLVGESITTRFDFTFTLLNTDKYHISGRLTSGNVGGFHTSVPFTVTYAGNATGTTSGDDVLTIDLLENLENLAPSDGSSPGNWSEGLSGSFGGPIAKTSSITGQLFHQGHAAPLIGPFSPPLKFNARRAGFSLPSGGNPLRKCLRRIMAFGAGSGVGAVIRNVIQ